MHHFSDYEEGFSLTVTVGFIDSLEKKINDLCVHTRRLDMYPFDTVAGEILSKAFALSRSSILLIQHGFADEAFGLSRSLYECSMYLRYITQNREKLDERANKFLEFGITSKAFWFDLLDENSSLTPLDREEVGRYKAENRIPDDRRKMTQPWSETRRLIETVSKEPHLTDADTWTEAIRIKDRAMAYTDTSCYVHCTQPGLNSYSFAWKEPIVVKRSRSVQTHTDIKTFMVIRTHLLAIARYSLFGMQVDPWKI